jgi:hypothetical protein
MMEVKEFYTLPSGKKVNAEPIRRGVKKYLKSEKGKKTREAYLKSHKDEHHDFNVNYHRVRRIKAFGENLCTRCCKEKALPGMTICQICRDAGRKYYQEHKKR